MDRILKDVPTSSIFWWVAINLAHLSMMLIVVAGYELVVPAVFFGSVAYLLGWIGQDCEQAERDALWLSRLLEEERGGERARRDEMRRERREMFASIGLGTDKDPFKDVDVLAGEE